MASIIEHVVEKVVENGEVLRDVDYATVRHGPNQFVVQGFNRNVPFVLTNMSPQALQKVYRRNQKSRTAKKGFKNKTHSQKRK